MPSLFFCHDEPYRQAFILAAPAIRLGCPWGWRLKSEIGRLGFLVYETLCHRGEYTGTQTPARSGE